MKTRQPPTRFTTKTIMSAKGLTMIELIIVIFVSFILLGGSTSLIFNMIKSQQAMQIKNDQHALHSQILLSLRESSSCEGNFATTSFAAAIAAPGTNVDMTSRFLGNPGSNNTYDLYARDTTGAIVKRDTILSNTTRLGNTGRITSMRLEGIQDLGSGTVKADLVATIDPGDGFTSMKDMRWEGLMFIVNAGNVVQDCLLNQKLQCAMAELNWRVGVCNGVANYATDMSYWPQDPEITSTSEFITLLPTAGTTWGATCNGHEWVYTGCSMRPFSGSAIAGGVYTTANNGCQADKAVASCANATLDTRMYITCCRSQ